MFRDAATDDLPALVHLLADDVYGVTRERPSAPLDPRYRAGFDAMLAQGGRFILAVEVGAIIGCLQLNIIHGVTSIGTPVAQVESVRVASAFRNRGVGRALVSHVVAIAREAGCRQIQLTTRLERTDAQRFYTQAGFARSHAGYKLVL